jgi:hypothetical protein
METTKGQRPHRIRCACNWTAGHETVAEVRECVAEMARDEADARADYELMRREEAHWENGGRYAEQIADEAAEDLARAWN